MTEEKATYEAETGFVYLVKPTGKNVYKIGYTNNPERRLKRYNNSKQLVRYEFLELFPCVDYQLLESRLHFFYQHHKLSGEWFAIPDDIIFNFGSVCKALGDKYGCL